jgi:uncharacterized OB-fold protein
VANQILNARCPNCGTLVHNPKHGWLPEHRDKAIESTVVEMREANAIWAAIANEVNLSYSRVRAIYARWKREQEA